MFKNPRETRLLPLKIHGFLHLKNYLSHCIPCKFSEALRVGCELTKHQWAPSASVGAIFSLTLRSEPLMMVIYQRRDPFGLVRWTQEGQIVTNHCASAQRHPGLFLLFWNILLTPDLGLLGVGLGRLLGRAAVVSSFLALLCR